MSATQSMNQIQKKRRQPGEKRTAHLLAKGIGLFILFTYLF